MNKTCAIEGAPWKNKIDICPSWYVMHGWLPQISKIALENPYSNLFS